MNNYDYFARHQAYLEQYLNQQSCPSQRLKDAMYYAMFPGGKRFRGLLVYLTGELLNVNIEALDAIAAAIELTHSYSLVHDDLPAMDNDDLRRGKPSCHRAFDEGTAILVGDALQILAVQLLLEKLPPHLTSERTVEIVRILSTASGPSGMVAGQCLDLYELNQDHHNEADLYQIHDLKTGQLILACINMVIAAAPICQNQAAESLRTFAKHLGLAFQIQDDYLDRYDHVSLKKGRSSDLSNDKKTFADYYAQSDLLELVEHHFQSTIQALKYFKDRAKSVKILIERLKVC